MVKKTIKKNMKLKHKKRLSKKYVKFNYKKTISKKYNKKNKTNKRTRKNRNLNGGRETIIERLNKLKVTVPGETFIRSKYNDFLNNNNNTFITKLGFRKKKITDVVV